MPMLQGTAFRVLSCFYDQDVRTFVELCQQAGYPTDLGGYYIRQLLKGGYIEKGERGQYRILPKGKQQLALYQGKKLSALRPRLMVVLVTRQGDAFVVLRRNVQPFLGVSEWPASMVEHGEAAATAAIRLLRSRVSSQGEPQIVGFFRRIDLYGETVFDDKLFAVYAVDLPSDAALLKDVATGENVLCTEQQLRQTEKPSRSLLDIFEYAMAGQMTFREQTYHLTAADLSLTE